MVLVLGGKGQLGKCIENIVGNNDNYSFLDVEEIDITKIESIEKYINNNKVDVIVNCAAYTNVENAENDLNKVYDINSFGVKNLTKVCKKNDIFLIHISTDFVFNGGKRTPYNECDICYPLNVYGRSKLLGETAILEHNDSLIIRTSWLYSEYGKNFFLTMKDRITNKQTTNVVYDQIGSPTYAKDLANFIVKIIEENRLSEFTGIYHYSNEGSCSWYDFAVAIEYLLIGKNLNIKPCSSKEFKTIAERPVYSVMSKEKIKNKNIEIRHWLYALKDCVEQYNKNI